VRLRFEKTFHVTNDSLAAITGTGLLFPCLGHKAVIFDYRLGTFPVSARILLLPTQRIRMVSIPQKTKKTMQDPGSILIQTLLYAPFSSYFDVCIFE
jgi:hypothetical protein